MDRLAFNKIIQGSQGYLIFVLREGQVRSHSAGNWTAIVDELIPDKLAPPPPSLCFEGLFLSADCYD